MFTMCFELFTYSSFLFYICGIKNTRFSAYHRSRFTRGRANVMCKLYKFWTFFSTSAQIAQIFARIVRFCLFIPFFSEFAVCFPTFSIFTRESHFVPTPPKTPRRGRRRDGGAGRGRVGGIVVRATCRKRRGVRDIKKSLLFAGMHPLRRLRRHLPPKGETCQGSPSWRAPAKRVRGRYFGTPRTSSPTRDIVNP